MMFCVLEVGGTSHTADGPCFSSPLSLRRGMNILNEAHSHTGNEANSGGREIRRAD